MLPSLVAEDLRSSLTSFLGTTFALADDDVRAELERFIANPHDGVFRGPFVRLRTPFREADDTWRSYLDWAPSGFRPHKHQAEAWMRLASRDRLPEPTLVTTGTGSGKTESFLIPLLEHCRREEHRPGVKALVLYPMNALANDQARRIARLVHDHREELGDVTVGLYTGDSGSGDVMTETSVIENKHAMRKNPPDVLLTNYKMLDMLLLRSEDTPLFAMAGASLRYLVLDEFHTYDGAQGTDVAMLLRRLGMVLGVGTEERPLGAITPVATSATLGSGEGASSELRRFAATVFGAEFDDDALVREDRLSADEWATVPQRGAVPLLDEITTALRGVEAHEEQLRSGARLFLREALSEHEADELDGETLGRALRAHPMTRTLLALTASPRSLTEIAEEAEPSWSAGSDQRRAAARHAISLYLALLSRARAEDGRPLLTVDVQLWLREVSRLLRTLSSSPGFAWFEGALPEDGERSLPSVFCRHCGRSGWGVVVSPGGNHTTAPNAIWNKGLTDPSTARAWIFAPGEADQNAEDVRWIDPEIADFVEGRSGRHSNEVPVLVTPDADAARRGQCPSCGQERSIQFLGSRVATLASATLGQLFGSPDVAPEEKKTLVFTDSVQDASHRAAFVENRAYALNLRALIHRALSDHGEAGTTLDALGAAIEEAGRTSVERFAMLPPDLRRHETFARYPEDAPEPHVRRAVVTRMGFAATLEFGLASRTGRTLELTGAATAHVEVGDLDRTVRRALDDAARQDVQLTLDDRRPERTRAWARGVVERIRLQGGIGHRWLQSFVESDSRYSIWGGRPRREGMPAFPAGRAAPSFPTTARHSDQFDSVMTPRSWFAAWTSKVLGVPAVDGPRYVLALLNALAADGALTVHRGVHGSVVWWIPPDRVRVARTEGAPTRLRCSVCSTLFPGRRVVLDDLVGAPCQRDRCLGAYREERAEPDYYRELYRAGEVRRVIAREHTSLLPADERVALENSFKGGGSPGSPNVLTCTPTLELGIDIGDLSMVALTSLPRSTASYLQRVGRAGRLTGNALVVSLLPARPLELQRLTDPLTMIAGDVVPPACYLDATEILRRQYLASLVDRRARSGHATSTRLANDVFRGGLTPTSWLGTLVADARTHATTYVDEFLRGFGDTVSKDSAGALREWAGGAAGEVPGLERDVEAAVTAWNAEGDELAERIERVKLEVEATEALPSLDDAGQRELRRLFGELGAARSAMRKRTDMYWISALEAYGLLPNYALLDDTTTLDVGLWWIDEETGEHQSEEDQYVRGSRTALGELAPGATFYVRGTAVDIDAVDLGTSRNPATERRRFCPACGWSRRVLDTDTATATATATATGCPRCGSTTAGDTGQVLTTVPFRRASAYTSRETALREDDGEDRRKARFSVITTVDAEPGDISGAWRLSDYPFGVEVLRRADIRWINLGPQERGGAAVTIAGHETAAPQFVACRHCGVVPDAQRGVKELEGARHRGWCRQRREPDPNAWVTVALTHELRTQAVRLLVPPIVVADATVRTSFRAALLLGLREVLGGEPEHLDVVEAVDPSPEGSERWVMVLHDLVPGGTGYLERFADADGVRELLEAAVTVLERCACRGENLAACHRCLLPHVAPHQAAQARRDAALALITEIFGFWEPEPVETIQAITVGPHDTPIEKRFRSLVVRWAKAQGAAVTTAATTYGDSASMRFAAKHGRRQWQLTPQVKLGGVQPDFVLECTDHGVARIAVFCDGRRYHCSPEHNRLADDVGKRAGLRDQGYLVWAVTHQDLDAFEAVLDGGTSSGNPAIDDTTRTKTAQLAQKLAVPGSRTADVVLADALSALVDFLLRPGLEAWTPVAHALALVHATAAKPSTIERASVPLLLDVELTGAAADVPTGDLPVVVGRTARGAALALERRTTKDIRVWLGVDDRSATVGTDGQVAAWRDWLALSNVFQFLEPGRFAAHTTFTLEHAVTPSATATSIDPAWREIADTYSGAERDAVLALGAAGLPTPAPGLELDGGEVLVDLAWPSDKIAVLLEGDDEAASWLADHGWSVVPPSEDAIRSIMTSTGGASWA